MLRETSTASSELDTEKNDASQDVESCLLLRHEVLWRGPGDHKVEGSYFQLQDMLHTQ